MVKNGIEFHNDAVDRACMHDPAVYKDPDEFRPDRFIRDGKLNPEVLDPATIIFGSGRR